MLTMHARLSNLLKFRYLALQAFNTKSSISSSLIFPGNFLQRLSKSHPDKRGFLHFQKLA